MGAFQKITCFQAIEMSAGWLKADGSVCLVYLVASRPFRVVEDTFDTITFDLQKLELLGRQLVTVGKVFHVERSGLFFNLKFE